uniref:ribonuclease H n=1 Tax=Acrobeloides nanus TaxID=290746 RepID=A0A914C3D1_9BILA
MASKFYAVAHGFKRGIYEDWNEAKKNIDGFPQPVYKKFDSREEAEKYVDERTPKEVSLEVDESGDQFYAVARGKVVGIFTDYNEVKKHIADYPQPLHKKFSKLDEARAYYKKFALGEVPEEEKDTVDSEGPDEVDNNNGNTQAKKSTKEKAPAFYAVARGHKTGVFKTWAECQEQTKGFKGAKFKKFDNDEDAQLFAEGKTLKQIEEHKRKRGKDEEAEADSNEEAETKSKRRRVK